jgi:hypothetical protein
MERRDLEQWQLLQLSPYRSGNQQFWQFTRSLFPRHESRRQMAEGVGKGEKTPLWIDVKVGEI